MGEHRRLHRLQRRVLVPDRCQAEAGRHVVEVPPDRHADSRHRLVRKVGPNVEIAEGTPRHLDRCPLLQLLNGRPRALVVGVEHVLEFKRLRGYEHLPQRDYKRLMLKKPEERRLELVRERKAKGLGFLPREILLKTVPGSRPKKTKKSKRDSKRPLVLTQCPEAKKLFLKWYFSIYEAYKVAVKLYRLGKLDVKFPAGTYRPPIFAAG